MEIGFIIQARTGSTRFPNKVMIPFYGKRTILDIIITRLNKHYPEYPIILATTVRSNDDILAVKYMSDNRVSLFRGDEQNVLKRFIDAASEYNIHHVIRICADNPFLMGDVYGEMIRYYLHHQADYVSYQFRNKTPVIKSHIGLYGEIAPISALRKALKLASEQVHFEHVTNYIYTHPNNFRISFLNVPRILEEYFDKLRLTVDTQDDFDNMKKLYNYILDMFGEEYTLENILNEIAGNIDLQLKMQKQMRNNAK